MQLSNNMRKNNALSAFGLVDDLIGERVVRHTWAAGGLHLRPQGLHTGSKSDHGMATERRVLKHHTTHYQHTNPTHPHT
nr:unnamed protein product [Callosobruchus chinensis]